MISPRELRSPPSERASCCLGTRTVSRRFSHGAVTKSSQSAPCARITVPHSSKGFSWTTRFVVSSTMPVSACGAARPCVRRRSIRTPLGGPHSLPEPRPPGSIVILGGGAAGNAAAEMLRREGYAGRITMLSADESLPCDRPNLSKGYLSGAAPEETNPLRSAEFYRDHRIDLKLLARATSINTANRHVQLVDGSRYAYDALLLATGADPVRLEVPGADLPHVHYLRTVGDSRALIAKAATSRRAVVIGASFIGLEGAASLRTRNIEVHVVAPEACPMEHILGREVGQFFRTFHEQHGVKFHLGATVTSIDRQGVTLKSGEHLEAGLVVVGIGVRPATSLAEQAGLAIDRGITVNEYLGTSVPGV